jgi:hypothetical protein
MSHHSSHLHAMLSHRVFYVALSCSTLTNKSWILHHHSHPISHLFISIFWNRVKGKVCHNPCDNCDTESVTQHRVWDEIVFTWNVSSITQGSHIEHLWTNTWMLSQCCGVVHISRCYLNASYRPLNILIVSRSVFSQDNYVKPQSK